MLAWNFSSNSGRSHSKFGPRRILTTLLLGLVPIDGDAGRVRASDETRRPDAEADERETRESENVSRTDRPAAHPALPTHARNAVEEWIPAAILYGPPR